MTNLFKTLALSLAFGTAAFTGCEKSTAEKAKDVGRDTKDLTKDVVRDTGDAARDAGRKIDDTARDAGRKMDADGRETKDVLKDNLRDAKDAVKDAGKAVADRTKEAGTVIADKAKEVADAARKAFRGPVDSGLDKADKEIARLEDESKKANGDAKKALDEKVAKAKELRGKLAAKLKDLGEAGADKWEAMKGDIEQLSKDLNKSLGL